MEKIGELKHNEVQVGGAENTIYTWHMDIEDLEDNRGGHFMNRKAGETVRKSWNSNL